MTHFKGCIFLFTSSCCLSCFILQQEKVTHSKFVFFRFWIVSSGYSNHRTYTVMSSFNHMKKTSKQEEFQWRHWLLTLRIVSVLLQSVLILETPESENTTKRAFVFNHTHVDAVGVSTQSDNKVIFDYYYWECVCSGWT